jgi:hypothetical protein
LSVVEGELDGTKSRRLSDGLIVSREEITCAARRCRPCILTATRPSPTVSRLSSREPKFPLPAFKADVILSEAARNKVSVSNDDHRRDI